MNSAGRFRWTARLFLLTMIGALALPPATVRSQVQDGATITILRGQVAIVRPDGSAVQPAPSGTVVRAGDEIRTLNQTGALITFFVGTEIELGSDTTLIVDRVSRQGERVDVSLRQVFGTTLNRVQSFTDPGAAYRIDAGGAVALVRGTTFALLGPTPEGIVILICLEDCDARTSFGGVPLAPFVGYWARVEDGRIVDGPNAFRPDREAGYWNAAFEGLTTALQALQGDTRGVPAGQVARGSQQEIERQLRDAERDADEDDKKKEQERRGLSIDDVTVSEGETASFTVTLEPASSNTVTVAFATANGSAQAGSDYVATSGTLTFRAGETRQTIRVPTLIDGVAESEETFDVILSEAGGAAIVDGRGLGTIRDGGSPGLPTLSIDDVTVSEGDNATFTVRLSAPSRETVTVDVSFEEGTADLTDFLVPLLTRITFAPGETAKTITVSTLEDTTVEGDETFFVELSNPTNATLADASGTGTIRDVVVAADKIDLRCGSAVEGGPVECFASLSGPSGNRVPSSQTVTVDFATSEGTCTSVFQPATANVDYVPTSGTLTFAPGETEKTITIQTIADGNVLDELEQFLVILSNPRGLPFGATQGRACGTIGVVGG